MTDKPKTDPLDSDWLAEIEKTLALGEDIEAAKDLAVQKRIEAYESGDPSWLIGDPEREGRGSVIGGSVIGVGHTLNRRNRERVDLRKLRQERVREQIEARPGCTVADIAAAQGCTTRAAKRYLYGSPGRFAGLIEQGKVRAEPDPGYGTRYYPS
jgi:hypothetical protein